MIDIATLGIRRVYNIQKAKYFPMPDYNVSSGTQVEVTIYGKTLNDSYMHILYDHQDLDLQTVFLLDWIQKGLSVEKKMWTGCAARSWLREDFRVCICRYQQLRALTKVRLILKTRGLMTSFAIC